MVANRKRQSISRIASVAWRVSLRVTGLAGLIYIGIERDHPDPLLVIAFMTMAGLPTVIDLDRIGGKGKE